MEKAITPKVYWKKFLGVDLFKVNWFFKYWLYKLFGFCLPKLKDQQDYWSRRGQVYMDEIMESGYLERESFFQDMLIDSLKTLQFESFFEAGCGFGWNIRRVKEEFPDKRVGGVDFSITQLGNAKKYVDKLNISVSQGDICRIPLKDNAYDIGFSLGVFMNIHPDKIRLAVEQMVRVCKKYIIHLEYDEDNTTKELREKRAFKTNIVSHDYKKIYESLGKRVVEFKTYKDFGEAYHQHAQSINLPLERWEGFEGPEKYIWIVVEI